MLNPTIKQLIDRRETAASVASAFSNQVRVCGGSGCQAAGAQKVVSALKAAASEAQVDLKVSFAEACAHGKGDGLLVETGCQGLCQGGVVVTVEPSGTMLFGVRPKDAPDILAMWQGGAPPEKRLWRQGEQTVRTQDEIPFYTHQKRTILSGVGRLDPTSLDAYLAAGGFAGLANALCVSPPDIVNWVNEAGLRGMGGGGFPTARKWQAAIDARAARSADELYLVCNGDEGDPGAFMDCALMEGDPFRIIEGMLVAAVATGATHGVLYVRNEYPTAVVRLAGAIAQCRDAGLIGPSGGVFENGFDIHLVRGGGAFVCGESSALFRSVEGLVGTPRSKYVRSTEKGVLGKPTILNNVETFAAVTQIATGGAALFRSVGNESSRGTKAFCLTGRVNNTGLIEVPFGISVRKVVEEIGGGVGPMRKLKSVMTGGPSGGCLSGAQLDLPVDFDALTKAGSMMGSGGMIVLDDHNCMVERARYYTGFLLGESCGQCVPCREGLAQLYGILDRICRGLGQMDDLDRIDQLCQQMGSASICGLGKSAPNPVRSALNGFKHEFVAHIRQKSCPAGVCRELIAFTIDPKRCTGCGLCAKTCPVEAIAGAPKAAHLIDSTICIRCGACRAVCNDDAVVAVKRDN